MVRTAPFHGVNTGSIPVRDILMFNFNQYLKYNFSKYIFEIYYKCIYSLILVFILIIVCFLKIDSILFFFAKYLLLNINTPKIFYSNIIEIF